MSKKYGTLSDDEAREVLVALREMNDAIGRAPMSVEWKAGYEALGLPSYERVLGYFGGWNDALEAAGLTINRRLVFTDEEVEAAIHNCVRELGRVPNSSDYMEWRADRVELPAAGTITRRMSWRLRLAQLGYEVIYTKKNAAA
jgi:hypothetical protein